MRFARGWVLGVSAAAAIGVGLIACVSDEPSTPNSESDSGSDGSPLGIACSAGDHCAAGTCVDGFCCATACDGQCEACDVSGHEGTCSPVSGKPHHGTCSGDQDGTCAGSCDGTKVSSCTYPAVACGGTASCAGGIAQVPAMCGNGTCGTASTQTCALGCFQDSCLGVAQLAATYSVACAILTNGNVRCWGDNTQGQVAQGSLVNTHYANPTEVFALDGLSAKSIGAAGSSVCAVLGDGTVRCWGSNFNGELGSATNYGTINGNPTPTAVPGITGATFVSSASTGHFCAIVGGGAVKCWGHNRNGSFGAGILESTTPSSFTPQDVCAPGSTTFPCATKASGATFLVGGDDFMCGIFSGQVACWGNNAAGQLAEPADGGDADHPFPILVPGLGASTLAAGNGVACAASVDGGALCWGSNGDKLGLGTDGVPPITTPSAVCTKMDCSTHLDQVTSLSTFDESVCAAAAGTAKCWGSNTNGQLGDGTSNLGQNIAATTAVAGGVVQVASGGGTNYAVVVNGAERNIKCWGANFTHQCGDGEDGGGSEFTPVSPKW